MIDKQSREPVLSGKTALDPVISKITRDEMNIEFAGKVILVAGGTGGLGRAVSLAFLRKARKSW